MPKEDHNQDFADRLRSLIGPNETIAEFAASVGASASGMNKWLNRISEPGLSNLVKIATARDVSLGWLAAGVDDGPHHEVAGPDGDVAMVPHYSTSFSAGSGCELSENQPSSYIALDQVWIKTVLKLSVAALIAVDVSGDSMKPTLLDGDVALINTAEKTATDGIYCLRDEDRLIIKRLQRLVGGRLLIKSDNPAYESYELAANEADRVEIIGRAVVKLGEL